MKFKIDVEDFEGYPNFIFRIISPDAKDISSCIDALRKNVNKIAGGKEFSESESGFTIEMDGSSFELTTEDSSIIFAEDEGKIISKLVNGDPMIRFPENTKLEDKLVGAKIAAYANRISRG